MKVKLNHSTGRWNLRSSVIDRNGAAVPKSTLEQHPSGRRILCRGAGRRPRPQRDRIEAIAEGQHQELNIPGSLMDRRRIGPIVNATFLTKPARGAAMPCAWFRGK